MMDFLGLAEEDYADENPPVEVWPDNWPAVLFFSALGHGSWNMGPNGPIGLRYEAFREVRLRLRVTAGEWPDIFDALRIMEAAALDEIHKD